MVEVMILFAVLFLPFTLWNVVMIQVKIIRTSLVKVHICTTLLVFVIKWKWDYELLSGSSSSTGNTIILPIWWSRSSIWKVTVQIRIQHQLQAISKEGLSWSCLCCLIPFSNCYFNSIQNGKHSETEEKKMQKQSLCFLVQNFRVKLNTLRFLAITSFISSKRSPCVAH